LQRSGVRLPSAPQHGNNGKGGFVDILQSKKNNRFYVGSTNNLDKRYVEHISGFAKATKYLRPLELRFYQRYDTLKEARQIEYKLKRLKSREILERIVRDQIIELKA
jgi:putative endonuclease